MTYLLVLLAFFVHPNDNSPSAASVAPCVALAESLEGAYSKDGNDAVETILIEIPYTGLYTVLVTHNGEVLPDEIGAMIPQEGGGYKYKNAGGGEGDMTPTDTGMDLEMTAGDNKGLKTSWTKIS